MANVPRVLSGVQPTGQLHIGNYIGAISHWVREQDDFENFFCIVDLHALTVPEAINPDALRACVLDVAALYLACGIDPEKAAVFVQSDVRQHAELAWILNCITPMGWMEKMTQFKSKSEGKSSVSVGLFSYPILQAADILLYQADAVPVGDDQRQHIEITRDIADRFESLFGYSFTRPKIKMGVTGARVMGLDDPSTKMSKSSKNSGHAVSLLDTPKTILKKFKSAKTDSGREVRTDDLSAGIRNLIEIYQSFAGGTFEEACATFEGRGYGELKKEVGIAVADGLSPIREKYHEIRGNQSRLKQILAQSADRATAVAEATMKEVRYAVGVR